MGRIYEVAIWMGSGVRIHIPDFIKSGSACQKVMGGGYTDIIAIA
jgi:hypothetical protein